VPGTHDLRKRKDRTKWTAQSPKKSSDATEQKWNAAEGLRRRIGTGNLTPNRENEVTTPRERFTQSHKRNGEEDTARGTEGNTI